MNSAIIVAAGQGTRMGPQIDKIFLAVAGRPVLAHTWQQFENTPGIGEIIGGSQREERLENLTRRIQEMKLPEKDLWWYMELRKFGSAPHAGFGLGFERLILFVTGMTNIRDVIPFPRFPGNAEF